MPASGIEHAAASSRLWMTMRAPSAYCRVTTANHASLSLREGSKRRNASLKSR